MNERSLPYVTDEEMDASWEATGIRFEKPRTRRPLTIEMFGKPKGRAKRTTKKNFNRVWMRKAY